MKRLIFIQSVSSSEYEAGVVLGNWVANKFDTTDIIQSSHKVNSFEKMKNAIISAALDITTNDKLIICIDAHSNCEEIYFNDSNSSDRNSNTGHEKWTCFNEILDLLYDKFRQNALIIFVSCYSASYFSTLEPPHIPVIAAEEEINAMRAKELLCEFYGELCKNDNIEHAYDAMVQKFPLEDERKKEGKYKAVLKLFK